MKKTLAIIGAGDLGLQIAEYAISDQHFENVVFFDDYKIDSQNSNFPILGKTNSVEEHFMNKKFNELLIGIGYKHLEARQKYFNLYKDRIPFATLIHSSCWISKNAHIEKGSVLYPRCTIEANAKIRANNLLNINCSIAHDSVIEAHCFLSPSVSIAGFVQIGECSNLGINATVIDNVAICSNTQIGAGCTVIKNINKPGLYVGNPHRFIR